MEFRALLTGVPDVTVLKAAHHGSRNGVSPAWLAATKPEVVVISCGLNNQYGHPHPWALRYYGAVASEIYRTDWDGEVRVRGHHDGSYEVSTYSRRDRQAYDYW
jgi:competence protein ComEC